ncbi:squalene--hopene cyclase, partial [Paenibacillus chibensis]|nr:squalene--hopene cyclase [Paenibacillus chibensis]
MADVLKQVQAEMHRYVARIQSEQEPDGSWRYDFENGPMTDAGMLLLSALGPEDPELTQRLARRLIRQQAPGGEWKLYDDDGGHLSSTIEAYTSLLLTGRMERNAPEMKRAEAYILRHGGVAKAPVS